jgi:PilZ domain
MSAATALAFDKPLRRVFQRHPINVPLDLIALRSGVPENLPGRCTDISEAGVGAVVAGELAVGQQVAVELRLPNVGVPVRVRALVSYQSRLRCGLEFVGLSVEQREMIRYWSYRSSSQPIHFRHFKKEPALEVVERQPPIIVMDPTVTPKRTVRIVRRGLYVLMVCMERTGKTGTGSGV